MRKVLLTGLILSIVLIAATGCKGSAPTAGGPGDSMSPGAASAAPASESAAPSPVQAADTRDKEALFAFVKAEISDITPENFDVYRIFYFDITGDGSEEAVIVGAYGEVWLDGMVIVSGDSGAYTQLPCEISLAKYDNIPDFKDGFFTVTSITGGTGAQYTSMSIYVYNGTGLISVLENLDIEQLVSAPDTDFVDTGVIKGTLNDFEYIYTHYDNISGEESMISHIRYTYVADTMSYSAEQLDMPSDGASAAPAPGAASSVRITDLKVGAEFYEDATISEISFITQESGAVELNMSLKGTFVLEGQLMYSEYFDEIIFLVTPGHYEKIIRLGGDYGEINPFNWPMGFRNREMLQQNIGDATYNKLLNDPEYRLNMTVTAKDYSFSCWIPGDAGGSWELIEINAVNPA